MGTSLPRAVPFVGRAADLAAVARWFDEGARLVTLLGPGGIGKTSLAAELAAGRGDGTALAWCALEDEAPVLDAVALALGASVTTVASVLEARGPLLLVLDNVDEAADEVAPVLQGWLRAAPALEVLVTSRRRLAIVEEIVHEVSGLGEDALPFLEAAARRRAAGFTLRGDDAAHARAIAARVEGSPLALEMAAARLPLVGARALLAEIAASPAALQRDVRGAARHASLEAAVEGSVRALPPDARAALAELAVFHGGFTVTAMEAVVALPPGAHARMLAELRDRSLVRTRDAAHARFDLHGAVRDYLVRHEPARIAAAEERHASWFTREAEHHAAHAARDRAARAWIVRERENLLAIASRASAGGPVTARTAEPALRALVALGPWLLDRGLAAGVADLVGPVVERTRDSGADPRLTARALVLRAALRRGSRARDALKDLLTAETIARSTGDALLGADVDLELARVLLAENEAAAARQKVERAIAAYAAAGARAREAEALAFSARLAAAPIPLLERAAALVAEEDVLRGPLLVTLARAYAAAGDAGRAHRTFAEAIATAARLGDATLDAEAHLWLGATLAPSSPDAGPALARARDGFELAGLPVEAAIARGYLGLVARAQGDAAEAYALLAAARDAARTAGRTDEARRFEAELAAPIVAEARPPANALVVAEGGRAFIPPGGVRVGLERRRNLALLLDHLATAHAARPGAPTSSLALFRVGWPGEKALPSAGAHRVRVAIATLRKLGLGDRLATLPDGYALSPELVVVRV